MGAAVGNDQGSDRSPEQHDPHSSFSLSITLSVGYERKRAFGTRLEGPIVSLALLAGGLLLVAAFVWLVARWSGLL